MWLFGIGQTVKRRVWRGGAPGSNWTEATEPRIVGSTEPWIGERSLPAGLKNWSIVLLTGSRCGKVMMARRDTSPVFGVVSSPWRLKYARLSAEPNCNDSS